MIGERMVRLENEFIIGNHLVVLPIDWAQKIGIPWTEQVHVLSQDENDNFRQVDTGCMAIRCADGRLELKGGRLVYTGIGVKDGAVKCNLVDVDICGAEPIKDDGWMPRRDDGVQSFGKTVKKRGDTEVRITSGECTGHRGFANLHTTNIYSGGRAIIRFTVFGRDAYAFAKYERADGKHWPIDPTQGLI